MDLKGRFLCRPSAVANAAAMHVGQRARARAPSKADAAVDRRRRGGKDGGVRVRPSVGGMLPPQPLPRVADLSCGFFERT